MDYGKKFFTNKNKFGFGVTATMRLVNQPEILNFITHNPGKTEKQIMEELYDCPNFVGMFQESNKKYADRLRALLRSGKISRVRAETENGPRFIYFATYIKQ